MDDAGFVFPDPQPERREVIADFDSVKRAVQLQKARDDFYFFSRHMFKVRRGYQWVPSLHHSLITEALGRVLSGETKRLIINVPPRYSKTELAVINFMAYCLGRWPDCEFIHTSYSGRLAANNSWQTRELAQHPEYKAIFPDTLLRGDSSARDEWRTTEGGCVYAVGAEGTITGYGAGKMRSEFGGAIVIDDPHKANEARSDVIREGVIEWFQNTLESRKNGPDTPIILIMQRLHERDLAGWLLDGGNGEDWESLVLPAIQPDGSALWPFKHDIHELRRMEQAAPMTFAGQYMQAPAPAEGNIFKPDGIRIVEAVPADPSIRWVRGWDLAATADGPGKGPDWTVGFLLGFYPDGRLIIADVARIRGGPDEVERAIVNTAHADGHKTKVSLPQDPGQAGKFQAQYLVRKLQGYAVHTSPESGDKVTRAEPFASQVNVGNVSMVAAPWNNNLKAEMRVFPNGSHDDIVDAGSRAYSVFGARSQGNRINPDVIRQLSRPRPSIPGVR